MFCFLYRFETFWKINIYIKYIFEQDNSHSGYSTTIVNNLTNLNDNI